MRGLLPIPYGLVAICRRPRSVLRLTFPTPHANTVAPCALTNAAASMAVYDAFLPGRRGTSHSARRPRRAQPDPTGSRARAAIDEELLRRFEAVGNRG